MTDEPIQETFRPIVAALRDGRQVTLRAIRPDDQEAMRAAFGRLSGEARYTRFMAPMKELSPGMLERAVRPVPDQEPALDFNHGWREMTGAGVHRGFPR